MKPLLLFIILFFSLKIDSQNIPLPQKCYPLNGQSSEDIRTGHFAEIKGKTSSFNDRFGISENAMCISSNSYIEIPFLTDSLHKNGISITFWFYIDNTNVTTQCFVAKDKEGNDLIGMQSNNGRAVLNLYHYNYPDNISVDKQWMWENCKFNAKGWYQVFIVYDTYCTNFYLINPQKELNQCTISFAPDWNLIKTLYMGGGKADLYIDDFKIYSTSLSEEEIISLNDFEAFSSFSPIKVFNRETLSELNQECLLSTNNNSFWYLHYAGKNALNEYNYYIQNKERFDYLTYCPQQGISLKKNVSPTIGYWNIEPISKDNNGIAYQIVHNNSGLYLTAETNNVRLHSSEKSSAQEWYLNSTNIIPTNIRKNSVLNEDVNISWDEEERTIIIKTSNIQKGRLNISLFSAIGTLIKEWNIDFINNEERIPIQLHSGVYIIRLYSTNVDIKSKIIVGKSN